MEKEKFYLTTAIAYTSKTPHVGNTYEIVLSDAIARHNRFIGKDVYFLTGTDEHGQKIQEIAEKEGITPKQHVDKIAGEIRDIADMLNISYDGFIRTTDEHHERAVQKIFAKLYEQGDIYKSEYEGWYCTPCESFWTKTQLKDGCCCPDCGREVEVTKEEAYFFKMSKYQKQLEEYIENNPTFIQPESRKNEMLNNFIKPGLQDLCVSRSSFSWGVPVEFDPDHVIYVWIDALSNYITALGYSVDEKGELYKKYWPANVHIIGKDILRFHTIYWPIMLMALGEPLPKQVFGHPWMLFGEEKMSKSRGNVIYAHDLVRHFGVDAVRYYMLHEMPFAQDGTITYDVFISRYNSDLANTLGNLVTRTVAMVNKYFGGEIQSGDVKGEFDEDLINTAVSAMDVIEKKMAELEAEMQANAEPEIEIAPYKDYIEFDEWEKLDIRVGKVIECEPVKKSKKLLRFVLEVGNEKRQILSGISQFHNPDELIGKNVVFIANLKPRKMMGLDSCGMILSAEHNGELTVLTTLKDIQSGAEIV